MPRAFSAEYKSTLAAVSAPEAPILLLEIDHEELVEPVRVCSDTQDITSNGQLYTACPFRFVLPDDHENQIPRARLAVTNIGRELMTWIEAAGGGQGATVRFMQVMRSRPNLIELDITMGLTNLVATMEEVSGALGYENVFGRPAIGLRYDPPTAPGLF